MESNALEKSTNNSVASRFFARTPRIRRIVKICDVNRFLPKPFWFSLSIFSMFSSMGSPMGIVDLGRYGCKDYNLSSSWQFQSHPFLGKRRMHLFVHLSIVFWLYTALQYRSSMSSNSLVFHTSGGISSSPPAFLFKIFLNTESSS